MIWDGSKKRATDGNGSNSHDLLIRIDENVKTFRESLESHILDDKEDFGIVNKRLGFLEKSYWVGIGVLIVVQWIIK